MIQLTIDGLPVSVPEGATILEAAEQLDIRIPTLCYHPDQDVKANCRICLVEVEGMKLLAPACSHPVSQGMQVRTHSPKVRRARRNILELILARHAQDCLHCDRSGTCELQQVAEDMHFVKVPRYPYVARSNERDDSSPAIVRNSTKCIACGRCEYACSEVQTVHALAKVERGFEVKFMPAYGQPLAQSVCVNCGQCVQACPTGALTIKDNTQIVWHTFANPDKLVIAQVAPAVRITLAEALGEPPGSISTGRLVTAMKRLGFHQVFDTDFTADLCIMEEGTELLHRLQHGGVLPMITSCSPGWIKFLEHRYPDSTGNLSTCKSPHMMLGALVKSYYANKMGFDPNKLFVVSIMPCTAKKFEIERPEMGHDGLRDVDAVLTTRELARMIREAGIDFKNLQPSDFDHPLGISTGAADIFGVSGGVMEAALRTVYELVTGREMPLSELRAVPDQERARTRVAELTMEGCLPQYDFLEGFTIKVAVTSGFAGAKALMEEVSQGKGGYHFIEVMGCPGGCVSGGGQPRTAVRNAWSSRAQGLYDVDQSKKLRKSHENPAVRALYAEFLLEPLSHTSHQLLHTRYTPRGVYNERLPQQDDPIQSR